MKVLKTSEIKRRLKSVHGWSYTKKGLVKRYEFGDFQQALDFIIRIAPFANELDHHPDIYNSYNRVKLTLFSHEAGGITELDFKLAEKVDSLVSLGST